MLETFAANMIARLQGDGGHWTPNRMARVVTELSGFPVCLVVDANARKPSASFIPEEGTFTRPYIEAVSPPNNVLILYLMLREAGRGMTRPEENQPPYMREYQLSLWALEFLRSYVMGMLNEAENFAKMEVRTALAMEAADHPDLLIDPKVKEWCGYPTRWL